MIVLWGIPSEPPLRLAIESAQRAGLEHVIVNQPQAAHHDLDVDLTRCTHGTLVVDGVEIPWGDIHGIHVRIMEPSYRTVILDVDTVTDVPSFPNLLSDTQGTTLVIIVPGRAATRAELATGTYLTARVRRAGPSEVFASPDGLGAAPPPS